MLDAFIFSFWNLGMHFRESGDFRSPWKDEVDGDRKGFSPASGHPQPLESPQKNLLMREWLSPALHFPLCVSEKHKWRSPHRQVCLPVKSPTTKICWTTQWKPLILCLHWHRGKIINVLRFQGSSYHGLAHRMEVLTRKKTPHDWITCAPGSCGVNGLMVGAAGGHRFDFNWDTNTALSLFVFFLSFHLNLAREDSHPKQKQTYRTL